MTKNDLKLVGIFFIMILSVYLVNRFFIQKEGAYAVINIEGEQFGSYSLEKDQIILIGDTNQVEIKEHSVLMAAANCPDKLCVHQKAISKKGQTIVCLPNKVVIEIKGNAKEQEVDVIVN